MDKVYVATASSTAGDPFAHHEWSDISAAIDAVELVFEKHREEVAQWAPRLTSDTEAIIAEAVRRG